MRRSIARRERTVDTAVRASSPWFQGITAKMSTREPRHVSAHCQSASRGTSGQNRRETLVRRSIKLRLSFQEVFQSRGAAMNCRTRALVGACLAVTVAGGVSAQDWPQWRGANRDAKVTGFHAPQPWPPKLTQKWKVTVGDGVATPAFVNNQLFVFSRQDGNTVIRCLNAETGKEVWSKKYEADDAEGAAARCPVLGPRSSPTVASGKVVTLDTRDTLCCFDAASGNQLWRKDDIHSWPRFFASSSPIVVDGLCIAQL